MLVLQRACWVDEAIANDSLTIPALHEQLEQARDWLTRWQAWGLWQHGRLLGMVTARRVDDDWHIGRFGVVPDMRGRDLGGWLLRVAEATCEPGCHSLVLSTGARSHANIRRYQHAGYELISRPDEPLTVCLAKPRPHDGGTQPRSVAVARRS